MEKKNRLITLKTFEEFKSDNANHYTEVLGYFNAINTFLDKNGVKTEHTKYNIDMINAGDWKIEGNINKTDLRTEDDNYDDDIIFHNVNGQDSMVVNITGYGETLVDKPGDDINPPEFENDAHFDVESITLWKEDGSVDYSIAVTSEIEKIILDIINKIAK